MRKNHSGGTLPIRCEITLQLKYAATPSPVRGFVFELFAKNRMSDRPAFVLLVNPQIPYRQKFETSIAPGLP